MINMSFLMVAILGLMILFSSSSWLLLWVGMELTTLSGLIIMYSFNKSSSFESVLKYFCIQSLTSVVLLLSGYIQTLIPGGIDYSAVLMSGSFLLKMGLVPFHSWVLPVSASLSYMQMFIVLNVLKMPMLVILMTLFNSLSEETYTALMVSSVVSLIIGAFLGLSSSKLQMMIAASSIAHSGWMVLGCSMGGMWLYYSIYSATNFLLLYGCHHSIMHFSLSGLLSLTGLPPFSMFWAKVTIMYNQLGGTMGWLVLTSLILSAIISIFFYVKFSIYFLLVRKISFLKSHAIILMLSLFSFLMVV